MSIVSERRTMAVGPGGTSCTATFERAGDGWWVAQVVEVPEAISQGRTLDEARANIADALETVLEHLARQGREAPAPAEVAVAPVTAAR